MQIGLYVYKYVIIARVKINVVFLIIWKKLLWKWMFVFFYLFYSFEV